MEIIHTLKFNSKKPLKMDGTGRRSFPLGKGNFSGAMLNFGRVKWRKDLRSRTMRCVLGTDYMRIGVSDNARKFGEASPKITGWCSTPNQLFICS